MLKTPPYNSRENIKNLLLSLQEKICKGLEALDGKSRFNEESWLRPEGGGGKSRVLKNGDVFEQAGVNFSEVYGKELPPSIISQRPEAKGHEWFATGTSMVLHPKNPFIPTVHLNYRYFEAGPVWWFGGGADLTPYYPYLKDVRHFHKMHADACEKINPKLHKVFKPWCDEYFFLKHRNEARGIGGIFYDYQDGEGLLYKGKEINGVASNISDKIGAIELSWENLYALAENCGNAFLPAYSPIIEKRINQNYSQSQREFQLYRRGRYVEFNLVWDRGTIFGLQTNGRTESILMSLPPLVRWEYAFKAEKDSREDLLTKIFTKPQDWQNDKDLELICHKHNVFD
ncbi:MAG: oxygen-dependent coproporphyrinogen oxidase [Prochlorococcus sp. SP3034]|nr:oxygen-dependent coproporphyrinogen oxidase [Prochlorococcus sp. SP3034]|tara:strand:+ start:7109 stop:8137 length:1029 start_codon:yes stop_codon:yes gene_type:complete